MANKKIDFDNIINPSTIRISGEGINFYNHNTTVLVYDEKGIKNPRYRFYAELYVNALNPKVASAFEYKADSKLLHIRLNSDTLPCDKLNAIIV